MNNAKNIGIGELELFDSTPEENLILDRLDPAYMEVSEMLRGEREFLNSLILRKKPEKLCEIGVSRGGSSVIMLNAITEVKRGHLFSLDYNTSHYRLKDKKTGDFVDNYPELKKRWTLRTGGLSLRFLEEIGGGIDFCLIDTVHSNPGEILDFLMLLPFLKNDAIIVFHDVQYHTHLGDHPERHWLKDGITNNLLMSSIHGKKIVEHSLSFSGSKFPNIGAIQLEKESFQHVFEIFNLLTIHWTYMLEKPEQKEVLDFFGKYYDKIYLDYLKDVFLYQEKCNLPHSYPLKGPFLWRLGWKVHKFNRDVYYATARLISKILRKI
jgi:predicted O-methyltransferase YrrM